VRVAFLLAAALLASACHRDDDDPDAIAFDPFVTDLIQNRTSDAGEPVEVDGRTFVFPTDEGAFDDVLPSDDGPVVEQ
jgi:hypothetical protein